MPGDMAAVIANPLQRTTDWARVCSQPGDDSVDRVLLLGIRLFQRGRCQRS